MKPGKIFKNFPEKNTIFRKFSEISNSKIDYNVIMKVESLDVDMDYFLDRKQLKTPFTCLAAAPNGSLKSEEDIKYKMKKKSWSNIL